MQQAHAIVLLITRTLIAMTSLALKDLDLMVTVKRKELL